MRNSILNGCGVHSDKLIEISEMLIEQKIANGEKVIEKDVGEINTQIFEAYQIILANTNDSNIIAKSIGNLKRTVETIGNVQNITLLSFAAVQKAIETTNKSEVEVEETIKKELLSDLIGEDKTKEDNTIEDRDEKFQKISEYFETILDSYLEEDSEKVYSNRVNEIINLVLNFKNNEFNEEEFIKLLKEGAINLIYEKKYGQQDGYEKIEEILKEVVQMLPEKKDFFDENGKINLKKIETEYELLTGEKINIEEAVENLKNAVENYHSDDFMILGKYLDIIDEYDVEKCQQLGGKLLKVELKNKKYLIDSIFSIISDRLNENNKIKNIEGIEKLLEITYTIYNQCENFIEDSEKKEMINSIIKAIKFLPEESVTDFYNKNPQILGIEDYKECDETGKTKNGLDDNLENKKEEPSKTEQISKKEQAIYKSQKLLVNAIFGGKGICFPGEEELYSNDHFDDEIDDWELEEDDELKLVDDESEEMEKIYKDFEDSKEAQFLKSIGFSFTKQDKKQENDVKRCMVDDLELEEDDEFGLDDLELEEDDDELKPDDSLEIKRIYEDFGDSKEAQFLKSIGFGLAKQERKEENDGKRDMVDENGDLILDDGDDELKLVEDEDYKEMSAEEAEKFCKNLGIDYPNEFNKSINENSGPDDLELEEEDSDFKDSDMEKLYQQIEEFENEEIENIEKNLKQKIEEYNFKPNEKILEEISYYQEQLKNFSNNKIQPEAPESLESMLKGKLEEYNETFDINLLKEIEELQNQIRLNEGKNFENISNKGIDKEEVSIREEDDDDAR